MDRIALALKANGAELKDPMWSKKKKFIIPNKLIANDPVKFDLGLNEEGGLRKYNIGETRQGDKKNAKVVVLMGEIGSGKIQFLNNLVNYLYEVEESDEFRFLLVSEQEEMSESVKWVTAYNFDSTRLSYRLTIVDMPCYDIDEGSTWEKQMTMFTKAWFEDQLNQGLNHIDAICLVANWLSSKIALELNQVASLFEKNMEKNVLLLLTLCDDVSYSQAFTALEDGHLAFSSYYKFSNSIYFEGTDMDRLQWMVWSLEPQTFKTFFDALELLQPQSIHQSKKVIHHREQLESMIIILHEKIKQAISQLETVHQEYKVIKEDQDQDEEMYFKVGQQYTGFDADISKDIAQIRICLTELDRTALRKSLFTDVTQISSCLEELEAVHQSHLPAIEYIQIMKKLEERFAAIQSHQRVEHLARQLSNEKADSQLKSVCQAKKSELTNDQKWVTQNC